MHIELLVEDSSGAKLIETLIPDVIGPIGEPHTWRIHPYKGIGRLPPGMTSQSDPAKRALLDQLPRLLAGYGKTPGIDAVVIVLDTDRRDCKIFLNELKSLLGTCQPAPNTLFRLAIEEMEAWLFGDRAALLAAYPKAKMAVLSHYKQDSVCGTWELLADAIYPGGSMAIRKAGWPLPGQIKHEWADKICAAHGCRKQPITEFLQIPRWLAATGGITRRLIHGILHRRHLHRQPSLTHRIYSDP